MRFLRPACGLIVSALFALTLSPAFTPVYCHNGGAQPVDLRFKDPPETCPDFGAEAEAVTREQEAAAGSLKEQAQLFAKNNGIECAQEKGKFVFKLKAEKLKTLFSVSADKDGLDKANELLAGLVRDKRNGLRTTFGVMFSSAVEVVDQQWVKNDEGEWVRGKDVLARLPRLNELYGIEAALYRAQPSHGAPGGSGAIKFIFLTDDLTKGERPLASYRSSHKGGGPVIFYYLGSCDGRPVLERDYPFDPTSDLGHAYRSIEALTLHEVAHNQQRRVGWYSTYESRYAGDLGYVDCGQDDDGYTIWAYKSSSKDADSNYKLYRKADSGKWFQCDRSGGKIADTAELTNAQMRKISLKRPMTYYFPSPTEIYAEGLMILRLGGEYRASLLAENPSLYQVVKRLDQEEIDAAYGKVYYYQWREGFDRRGRQVWYQVMMERSRYIRGTDGYLADNTDANRQAVTQFEQKARQP